MGTQRPGDTGRGGQRDKGGQGQRAKPASLWVLGRSHKPDPQKMSPRHPPRRPQPTGSGPGVLWDIAGDGRARLTLGSEGTGLGDTLTPQWTWPQTLASSTGVCTPGAGRPTSPCVGHPDLPHGLICAMCGRGRPVSHRALTPSPCPVPKYHTTQRPHGQRWTWGPHKVSRAGSPSSGTGSHDTREAATPPGSRVVPTTCPTTHPSSHGSPAASSATRMSYSSAAYFSQSDSSGPSPSLS